MSLATDFKTRGFVIIREFLSIEEVNVCKKELAAYISRSSNESHKDLFYEDVNDKSTLKQIQMLHQKIPYFNELMEKRMQPLASFLLDETAVGKNMQYFKIDHHFICKLQG